MTALAPDTEPAPAPRWATVAEASTHSGVPVSTLRRWIREERLPAHKIGPRKVQVDLNVLDGLRRPVHPGQNSGHPAPPPGQET